MPLSKCMEEHTHKQYQLWQIWLDEQWNTPDKHDVYLMQIACEVRRVLSKDPDKVRLDHFQLSFTRSREIEKPTAPMNKEQATAISKAAWLSRMTIPVVQK